MSVFKNNERIESYLIVSVFRKSKLSYVYGDQTHLIQSNDPLQTSLSLFLGFSDDSKFRCLGAKFRCQGQGPNG